MYNKMSLFTTIDCKIYSIWLYANSTTSLHCLVEEVTFNDDDDNANNNNCCAVVVAVEPTYVR